MTWKQVGPFMVINGKRLSYLFSYVSYGANLNFCYCEKVYITHCNCRLDFFVISVIFLSLLAQIANAYVPSTVEIPPVSENQMQIRGRPQGRNGVRDQRHSSYSYGTTAYHYDNQQGGFASARLSDPNANQQM